MPNWCYNRVNVYGDADTVDQVKEIYEIFENNNDPFHKIFPIPDFKNIPNDKGELPILEQHKNDDRWYHWCIENWGTKWDVSELDIEYDEEVLELTFSTAWSPPEGIIEKLREKYPDLSFTCFYDEPGMEVAGYY